MISEALQQSSGSTPQSAALARVARHGLSFNNPGTDPEQARKRFLEVLGALVCDPHLHTTLYAAASSWVKAERAALTDDGGVSK